MSGCLLIQQHSFAFDDFPQPSAAQRVEINQIHGSGEQFFEGPFQTEIPVELISLRIVVKFDDQIDIAARGIEIRTSRRTEDVKAFHAKRETKRGDFIAMLVDGRWQRQGSCWADVSALANLLFVDYIHIS